MFCRVCPHSQWWKHALDSWAVSNTLWHECVINAFFGGKLYWYIEPIIHAKTFATGWNHRKWLLLWLSLLCNSQTPRNRFGTIAHLKNTCAHAWLLLLLLLLLLLILSTTSATTTTTSDARLQPDRISRDTSKAQIRVHTVQTCDVRANANVNECRYVECAQIIPSDFVACSSIHRLG